MLIADHAGGMHKARLGVFVSNDGTRRRVALMLAGVELRGAHDLAGWTLLEATEQERASLRLEGFNLAGLDPSSA